MSDTSKFRIPLKDLQPCDYNPRTVTPDQLCRLQASIREHTNTLAGWSSVNGLRMATTITVNRNGNRIVGGHMRVKALASLGQEWIHRNDITWVDIVPKSAVEKSLNISLNNRENQGTFDNDKLADLLSELKVDAHDLFEGLELGLLEDMVVASGESEPLAGQTDPDAVPEPPDEAVSRYGTIYRLGHHRLMCGDSAQSADLDRLLAGVPIHLVNMDPPYNVNVEPRSNNAIAAGLSSFQATADRKSNSAKLRAKDRPLLNDSVSGPEFDQLMDGWFSNASRVLLQGHGFYIWGGYSNCGNYPPFLRKHKLYFSQAIIWDKQSPVLSRKDFMGVHEWCFYGWKEGAAHRFFGPNNVTDLWHVKKVGAQNMVHLTEKPVELAFRAISYSSKPGENVLDMFGGSGSTLMACEQSGRKAYLMEIDPLYCDVIRKRWAEFVHGPGCEWVTLTPAIEERG